MRIQQTWCPDVIPVLGTSSMKGVAKSCQDNLIEVIRAALARGINHFETARMYGTSEMQFVEAICFLIDNGEVKREDLIIQTKVPPGKTKDDFKKTFAQSWKHMQRLQYIDLFSFHGVSNEKQYNFIFTGPEANMEVAEEMMKEGTIRNIGVSSHGDAAFLKKLIDSNGFSYINLHLQYFGSYHATGTPDGSGDGGHGNAANVKLAAAKDMGGKQLRKRIKIILNLSSCYHDYLYLAFKSRLLTLSLSFLSRFSITSY
jgi:predicted aldo/keto reductase-like oxidoreductase